MKWIFTKMLINLSNLAENTPFKTYSDLSGVVVANNIQLKNLEISQMKKLIKWIEEP